MRLIGSRLMLLVVLIVALAAAVSATPTDKAVVDELMQMYGLDSSTCVVEVLNNRLKTAEVEPGELTIRPIVEKEPLGLFNIVATIERDGRMVESAQLRLRVTRFADVLVATDRIGMHDQLTPDNCTVRRMDITQLHEKVLHSLDDVAGMRTAKMIRKGTILTTSTVETPPDVEAGQTVTIVYSDGLCRITTNGTALQKGSHGDFVKVKNSSSGKIIVARVVDQNAVEVDP